MKKIHLSISLIFILQSSAYAQSSLEDQIGAVDQVQQSIQYEEKLEQERIHQKEQARISAIRKAEEKKQLAIKAASEAKNAERIQDKQRDQAFEDELRKMELEERKLELESKKTRVARTNDFIDQELKAQAAQTDVVQSNADALRNESEGKKELLKSEGKARETQASKALVTTVNKNELILKNDAD